MGVNVRAWSQKMSLTKKGLCSSCWGNYSVLNPKKKSSVKGTIFRFCIQSTTIKNLTLIHKYKQLLCNRTYAQSPLIFQKNTCNEKNKTNPNPLCLNKDIQNNLLASLYLVANKELQCFPVSIIPIVKTFFKKLNLKFIYKLGIYEKSNNTFGIAAKC